MKVGAGCAGSADVKMSFSERCNSPSGGGVGVGNGGSGTGGSMKAVRCGMY